jgi:HD-GYP domain-containing protein (c-di-GMP phosphodiesterase class II)
MQQMISKKSLLKALAWRLALVAAVMAMLVGILTYITARNNFTEIVNMIAMRSVARFNTQITPLLDRGKALDTRLLQSKVDDFTKHPLRNQQGRFVLATLYDLQGVRVAAVAEKAYPLLDVVKTRLAKERKLHEHKTFIFRVEGSPHVIITQPLFDSSGNTALEVVGAFAVAPEVITAFRLKLGRNILLAVAIILATTALLYPLLASLLGRVNALTRSLLQANLETIQVLGSAIAKRDSDTDIHNFRVTLYAVKLAEKLGLERKVIQGLIKGSFLHDVGKIGIHDQILLKPGRLDEEEFAEMKRHVEYGLDIVNRCQWLDDAAEVVGAHHEKFDGKGYLKGLRGEDIPITARIFALVDVFDALTARRPYKEPFTLENTLSIIRLGIGNHFDPQLAQTFIELAPKLHAAYAGINMESMQKELNDIIDRYFSLEQDG